MEKNKGYFKGNGGKLKKEARLGLPELILQF